MKRRSRTGGNPTTSLPYALAEGHSTGGGKEWIDTHAPEARDIKVEGIEPK